MNGAGIAGFFGGLILGGFIVGDTMWGITKDKIVEPAGSNLCDTYKEAATKLNQRIIDAGQSGTVTVTLPDGATCTFQHVPPAPVVVPNPS